MDVCIQLLCLSWSVFTVFRAICCYFLHEQIKLYKRFQFRHSHIHFLSLNTVPMSTNMILSNEFKEILDLVVFFFSPILYVDLLLQICIDFRINTMECMSNRSSNGSLIETAHSQSVDALFFLRPLWPTFGAHQFLFESNNSDKGHDGVPIEDVGVEKTITVFIKCLFWTPLVMCACWYFRRFYFSFTADDSLGNSRR